MSTFLDEQEDFKSKETIAEYVGFFANPAFFFKFKHPEPEEGTHVNPLFDQQMAENVPGYVPEKPSLEIE